MSRSTRVPVTVRTLGSMGTPEAEAILPPTTCPPLPARDLWTACLLFVATLTVYAISNFYEGPTPYAYHVFQAQALLEGRLDLPHMPWLELAEWEGRFYTVNPPLPALLLVPAVALFGAFPQGYASVLFGAINTALCFLVVISFFRDRRVALWTSLLSAFGTIHWYHAEVGSGWYFAHIVGITFLWISLLLAARGAHLFWASVMIGAAFLSRYPTALGGIFLPVYFFATLISFEGGRPRIHPRPLLALLAGLVPALLLYFAYNYVRWGGPWDMGYTLVLRPGDPNYIYGLFNFRYIPIHLVEMFTTWPRVVEQPPYLVPSLFAMAIWIATPALVLTLRAPLFDRLTVAAWAAVLLTAVVDLSHGGNGFTQFGYRHTLDFLPFLLLLVAAGMRGHVGRVTKSLVAASILVNTWGVVTLSVLRIHTF